MNFGELKSLSLAYVAGGKAAAISDATRGTLINAAVADLAIRSKAIRTQEDFDSLSSTSKYNLSVNLTRFLKIDEGGVWFDDGNDFKQLRPYSVSKMKNEFPNFQQDEASVPLRYYLLGGDLHLHPSVETGGTDKIRVYLVQRPQIMTAAGHYPFHKEGDQSTEDERLEILSESILLYVEARILKILGEGQEAILKFQEYRADVTEKLLLINERVDISGSKYSKFQGPRIGR